MPPPSGSRIAGGEGLDEARGTNCDGDGQKALDVIADEAFRAALEGSDVRFYASEEREEADEIGPSGTLALAIDPLGGSRAEFQAFLAAEKARLGPIAKAAHMKED